MTMRGNAPDYPASQISALAAYLSRLESAATARRPTNTPPPPPTPPPEVAMLLRTLAPRDIRQISEQLARMTNRHPAIIAAILSSMIDPEGKEPPQLGDPPAAPRNPQIPLAAAARAVTIMADRVAFWAGTLGEQMLPEDSAALELARSFGWRPLTPQPESTQPLRLAQSAPGRPPLPASREPRPEDAADDVPFD